MINKNDFLSVPKISVRNVSIPVFISTMIIIVFLFNLMPYGTTQGIVALITFLPIIVHVYSQFISILLFNKNIAKKLAEFCMYLSNIGMFFIIYLMQSGFGINTENSVFFILVISVILFFTSVISTYKLNAYYKKKNMHKQLTTKQSIYLVVTTLILLYIIFMVSTDSLHIM